MGQDNSIEELLSLSVPLQKIDKESMKAIVDTTFGYINLSKLIDNIGRGKWNQLQIGKVMPYITVWKIRKGIVLDENFQSGIVKSIEHVHFPYLIELALRRNNI